MLSPHLHPRRKLHDSYNSPSLIPDCPEPDAPGALEWILRAYLGIISIAGLFFMIRWAF